eukprot:5826481-Pleurochrysis_carterae.AAC.1
MLLDPSSFIRPGVTTAFSSFRKQRCTEQANWIRLTDADARSSLIEHHFSERRETGQLSQTGSAAQCRQSLIASLLASQSHSNLTSF